MEDELEDVVVIVSNCFSILVLVLFVTVSNIDFLFLLLVHVAIQEY